MIVGFILSQAIEIGEFDIYVQYVYKITGIKNNQYTYH